MDDQGDQTLQRIKKLETLRSMGVDPFGERYEVLHTAGGLLARYADVKGESLEQEKVTCQIAGRILSMRRFGKAAFSHLQDATGRIQAYFKKDVLGDRGFEIFEQLDLGDIIGISGELFRTKTDELTIQVGELTLLSKALRPLPEKWHGLTDTETRYRQRYLDLISNPKTREVFLLRNKIIKSFRSFLDSEGFLEVETPMMQPLPGGAAARPFRTHHNALNVDLFLRIAPELFLKRLIVGGIEKVYEINRNFRNEGISTVHNPEFTMLEFYMAYADFHDLILFSERLLSFVAEESLGRLKVEFQGNHIDLTPPWNKVHLTETVLERYQLNAAQATDTPRLRSIAESLSIPVGKEDTPGTILLLLFEKTIEPTLIQPTFVMDYPTETSPLAKRKSSDPTRVDRFELFIGGLEIANGFSELNDPQDQRARFESQAKQRAAGDSEAHPMDEDYIRALEYGLPPTGGEGIGLDRFVMLLTNQSSIREVILFPLLRPEPAP